MHEGRVVTLEEVTSTQDAAVEHDLQVGDVCISFNQTAGRGRRVNEWNSKGGVAVTVVLEELTPQFSIAIAATLAAQVNTIVPTHTVRIKWPNDLYVEGKKLAGVLIEQRDHRFLVGIGINVEEIPLPNATSLAELGSGHTKESVASLLAASVFEATNLDEMTACAAWRTRDMLIGTVQRVQSGDNIVEGLVLDIDPCHNLLLEIPDGILTLPAATTTIITPC
ncbi:MAG TPA: biotin--[acetyl-CoA-carboxylase] ligase [Flavobacteriales bacterium]|nr:biotin--[acetyl-CoA-carboxylase] ligase [Flavobacteriales bacterium]